MKIIIGFSKSKNPLAIGSKVISEVESRNYSHSYIRYDDPYNKVTMIFQASKGYVNLTNFELFKLHNHIIKEYELDVTTDKFDTLYNFITSNLGIKYSKLQIFWLSLKKVLNLKKWPQTIYNFIKNGTVEQICSELALRVLDLLDDQFEIPNDFQVDQFTPSDLDDLLTKLNIKITYG